MRVAGPFVAAAVVAALVACPSLTGAKAPPAPPRAVAASVKLERIARGLDRPVALAQAPGDPTRLFIVEQHVGRIRIWRAGKIVPTPVLDLGDAISTGDEQGLLGLAFAPD